MSLCDITYLTLSNRCTDLLLWWSPTKILKSGFHFEFQWNIGNFVGGGVSWQILKIFFYFFSENY